MKIAVVFLLVAVSTCYAYLLKTSSGGHVIYHSNGEDPNVNCLQKTLKTDLQRVLSAVQKLFCSYENCKERAETNNKCSLEEWTVLFEKVKVILKDVGCTVDWIAFNGTPTVEIISEAVGKALGTIRTAVRDLMMKLGVAEPVLDLLCDFLGDVVLQLKDVLVAAPLGGLGGISGLMRILSK